MLMLFLATGILVLGASVELPTLDIGVQLEKLNEKYDNLSEKFLNFRFETRNWQRNVRYFLNYLFIYLDFWFLFVIYLFIFFFGWNELHSIVYVYQFCRSFEFCQRAIFWNFLKYFGVMTIQRVFLLFDLIRSYLILFKVYHAPEPMPINADEQNKFFAASTKRQFAYLLRLVFKNDNCLNSSYL